MLVLALPGSDALAQALAGKLSARSSPLMVRQFPDGETLVRIDAPVAGEEVVIAGSLDQPDFKVMPLLFAADAARELGARRVGLVAPYLGYMRQDARFHDGEAITSRTFARLLSTSLDYLVTVDPHLHRYRSLSEVYTIRTEVVQSAPCIARWLAAEVPQPIVVGPDAESEQWVSHVARLIDAPWTVLTKTRRGDRDVSVELHGETSWEGHTPVLLDDIASTGHTLLAAAEWLKAAGHPASMCVVVHALLEPGAAERLAAAGISRIASCDTVLHASNAISVGDALTERVRAVLG